MSIVVLTYVRFCARARSCVRACVRACLCARVSDFVNTVFCTVGFGDISAENTSERLFCVLLFYMGTLVFGMLLAEVQDALAKTRHLARERENTVQVMVTFCRHAQVPLYLEKQVVNWIEFTMEQHQKRTNQEELLKAVPPNLHRQLMSHLHKSVLSTTMPFMRVSPSLHHLMPLMRARPTLPSPYHHRVMRFMSVRSCL